MTAAEIRKKETPEDREIRQRKRSESKDYCRAVQIKGKDETKYDNGRAESTKAEQGETERSAGQEVTAQ